MAGRDRLSAHVHGTGGQTRAFIHIRDSVKCLWRLAVAQTPPKSWRKGPVIYNQMTESHKVKDLAEKWPAVTGAKVSQLPTHAGKAIKRETSDLE